MALGYSNSFNSLSKSSYFEFIKRRFSKFYPLYLITGVVGLVLFFLPQGTDWIYKFIFWYIPMLAPWAGINAGGNSVAWFGLTAPLILMGAIADKLTNKERQKTADLVADVGVENAQLIDDKLKVSKNGNLYKPTGNATLIGGAGLIGVLTLSGISHILFKKGIVKNEIFKHFGFLAKMFTEAGPSDEIGALIAALPAVLPILPLLGSDWLNNQEAKKKS